jgi:gliding motility-associated-like protein/uncharacterized repeat protein (TIGR01451 family)
LCGTTNADVVVTVSPATGPVVFISGATTLCQDAPNETYAATAANSTSIAYSVSPAAAGVMNATTGVMNWNSAFSGMATITATAMGICETTTASRVVTVNQTPVAVANSNSPICEGSSIFLSAQTVVGGTYNWTGPGGYSTSVQNPEIISASNSHSGIYTLIVTLNGCVSAPSMVTVVVNNCASADLGVIKTVNNLHPLFGHTVVFTIIATNYGPFDATGVEVADILESGYAYVSSTTTSGAYNASTGIWTIGMLANGASETLTITATVNSSGNYMNTATISGIEPDFNLANNVSTVATDPKDLFIPEGYSPNNDGINDYFVIRGIFNYPNNSIVIFNRWGNKVFEASPYQNNWDGKATMGLRFGGDELPVGTYFYLLDLGDGSEIIKGTIYLNR